MRHRLPTHNHSLSAGRSFEPAARLSLRGLGSICFCPLFISALSYLITISTNASLLSLTLLFDTALNFFIIFKGDYLKLFKLA